MNGTVFLLITLKQKYILHSLHTKVHSPEVNKLLVGLPNGTHYSANLMEANADKGFCLRTQHIDIAGI